MSRARDTADQINRVNSSAADATAITVDSSENVGIGVTPETWDTSYRALQFAGNGALSGWGTQTNGAAVFLSQNAYKGSTWKYISGTDEASLYEKVNGAHTFYTASSGSADSTISWNTKLKIDSDGLKFNGDTAAANALHDYEYGSWTPTTPNGGSVTANNAVYTKIGDQVTIWCLLQNFTDRSTVTSLTVKGLPFNTTNAGVAVGTCMGQYVAREVHTIYMASGSGLQFYKSENNTGFTVLNHSNLQSSSSQIYLMATYTAA